MKQDWVFPSTFFGDRESEDENMQGCFCFVLLGMLVWALSSNASSCYSFSWIVLPSVWQQRFVSCSRIRCKVSFCSTITGDEYNSDLASAQNAFSILARKSKSWKRLGPIVDLALADSCSNRNSILRSVCDVGTDHGLLATGLAMTSRFNRVVGVDVSERAMQDGALKLYDEILSFRRNSSDTCAAKQLNLDFRRSDGLQNVYSGEADVVCIAGMGVNTMVDILTARKENAPAQHLLLDHLCTQQLLLQPSNSRPQKLMFLYNRLRDIGWTAQKEKIAYISSRWYLTTLFERSQTPVLRIPGAHLALINNVPSNDSTRWIAHHRKWIQNDALKTGTLRRDDEQWLEGFKQHNVEK